MTTRLLVDPELAALLDQVPTVELTEEIVKQVRAIGQTQKLPNLPTFPDIEVTECFVPGPEGASEVRVLLYLPIKLERDLACSGCMGMDILWGLLSRKISWSSSAMTINHSEQRPLLVVLNPCGTM